MTRSLVFAEKISAQTEPKIIKVIPLKATQGVAVSSKHFYTISNTQIKKYDKKSDKWIASWSADQRQKKFKHFKHLNSGTVVGNQLFCAHSRFPTDRNASTVEIWNIELNKLEHLKSIPMPRKYGSLTWIDQKSDGSWWMCFAHYGKHQNDKTILIQYSFSKGKFIEQNAWYFPIQVIKKWGSMSCSGGSWGPDGKLYTSGHDHHETHILEISKEGQLVYLNSQQKMGFFGQAIAWDRSVKDNHLWGIVKNKNISVTSIPTSTAKTP